MCEYCEKPNKTIVRHISGVEAFVESGHLFARFYDKGCDKTWLTIGGGVVFQQ